MNTNHAKQDPEPFDIAFNACQIAAGMRVLMVDVSEAVAHAAIAMSEAEADPRKEWDGGYDDAVAEVREIITDYIVLMRNRKPDSPAGARSFLAFTRRVYTTTRRHMARRKAD